MSSALKLKFSGHLPKKEKPAMECPRSPHSTLLRNACRHYGNTTLHSYCSGMPRTISSHFQMTIQMPQPQQSTLCARLNKPSRESPCLMKWTLGKGSHLRHLTNRFARQLAIFIKLSTFRHFHYRKRTHGNQDCRSITSPHHHPMSV